jgi:hypothetical protein
VSHTPRRASSVRAAWRVPPRSNDGRGADVELPRHRHAAGKGVMRCSGGCADLRVDVPDHEPTHSAEIGTSRWTTVSTLTTWWGRWSGGTRCVAAAGDDRTEHDCHHERTAPTHHEPPLRWPVPGVGHARTPPRTSRFHADHFLRTQKHIWCNPCLTGRRMSQRDVERTLGRLLADADFRSNRRPDDTA